MGINGREGLEEQKSPDFRNIENKTKEKFGRH